MVQREVLSTSRPGTAKKGHVHTRSWGAVSSNPTLLSCKRPSGDSSPTPFSFEGLVRPAPRYQGVFHLTGLRAQQQLCSLSPFSPECLADQSSTPTPHLPADSARKYGMGRLALHWGVQRPKLQQPGRFPRGIGTVRHSSAWKGPAKSHPQSNCTEMVGKS